VLLMGRLILLLILVGLAIVAWRLWRSRRR
jgi:hypothetical protein